MKQIGPLLMEKKSGKREAEERARQEERVATSFLQEKSRLGPLMFIPGRVLHLEEVEQEERAAR